MVTDYKSEIHRKRTMFEMRPHYLIHGNDGSYYCRCMHTVVPLEVTMCDSCPLHFVTPDGEECCRYYVPKGVDEDAWTPDEQMEQVSLWIERGMDDCFPYFVEGDAAGSLLVEAAVRYAARAHFGDMRKGNHIPYIAHPVEVMMLSRRMTNIAEVMAAASLHDVVEDTCVKVEDIRREFGEKVAALVCMESEDKRENLPKSSTWKLRKSENLIREMNAPVDAKRIMLADKVSNMRSTLRDFRESGHDIWNKFNMKDVHEQAWYYRSVAKVLSDLSSEDIYGEYIAMIEEVFSGIESPELITAPAPSA